MTTTEKRPRSRAEDQGQKNKGCSGPQDSWATPGDRPIDTFIDRLDGPVRRSGRSYSAKCPAHRDRTPSLSFREADDGTVLVKCFAGCDTADVLEAVGLRFRDLFQARTRTGRREAGDATLF